MGGWRCTLRIHVPGSKRCQPILLCFGSWLRHRKNVKLDIHMRWFRKDKGHVQESKKNDPVFKFIQHPNDLNWTENYWTEMSGGIKWRPSRYTEMWQIQSLNMIICRRNDHIDSLYMHGWVFIWVLYMITMMNLCGPVITIKAEGTYRGCLPMTTMPVYSSAASLILVLECIS